MRVTSLLKPFQIIGGGTSGLTVARRLAANPAVSVAVIEAGSFYEIDNGNVSQIPNDAPQYSSPDPTSPIQPLVDWGIMTTPQTVRINRSDVVISYIASLETDCSAAAIDRSRDTLHSREVSGWRVHVPIRSQVILWLIPVLSPARNYLAYHR